MNWLNNIGGLLQQYANAQGGLDQSRVEQDFDEVSRHAPAPDLAAGLSEAFRSPQTQPFPNMLGQLFANSNPGMKSSILNTLIAAVGPQVLSGILARHGAAAAPGQIDPDRVPPSAVEEIAEQAEKQNPTIIDQISDFYAQHPTVVKGLGAAALGIALNHLAKQKRGGLF